jgi:hypothetical protein
VKTPVRPTLLDLVQRLGAFIDDDREVVATAAALINSGRVRLCGTFAPCSLYPTTLKQPTRLALRRNRHD